MIVMRILSVSSDDMILVHRATTNYWLRKTCLPLFAFNTGSGKTALFRLKQISWCLVNMFLTKSLTSTLCKERQKKTQEKMACSYTHGNTSLVGDISEIDAFKSQRVETLVEVVTFFF